MELSNLVRPMFISVFFAFMVALLANMVTDLFRDWRYAQNRGTCWYNGAVFWLYLSVLASVASSLVAEATRPVLNEVLLPLVGLYGLAVVLIIVALTVLHAIYTRQDRNS